MYYTEGRFFVVSRFNIMFVSVCSIVCICDPIVTSCVRVAKFACPRVLDDQKMSEDNQNLRSGWPPDYQIFWEKYFENNCPYTFFKNFILTLSFSNKHISFWYFKTNCNYMVLK